MEDVAPFAPRSRPERVVPRRVDDRHVTAEVLRRCARAGHDACGATQAGAPERGGDEVARALVRARAATAVLRDAVRRQLEQPDDDAPFGADREPVGQRHHRVDAAERAAHADLLPRERAAFADDDRLDAIQKRCGLVVANERDDVVPAERRERLHELALRTSVPLARRRDRRRVNSDARHGASLAGGGRRASAAGSCPRATATSARRSAGAV